MFIKKLSIESLGNLERFDFSFCEGVNVLRFGLTDEITYALGLIMNCDADFLPLIKAGNNTRISAEVCVCGVVYSVIIRGDANTNELRRFAYDSFGIDKTEEYYRAMWNCREHNLSNFFIAYAFSSKFRLLEYWNEDDCFTCNKLSKLTNGLSELRCFRRYLYEYITNFEYEFIRAGKKLRLVLDNRGNFGVNDNGKIDTNPLLSESDNIVFCYLCFLKTAEFWQGFEAMRNLNYIKKPLVVDGFIERLDDAIDVFELVNISLKLERQLIFVSDK